MEVAAAAPTSTPWGNIQISVTIDLTQFPLVHMVVPSAQGQWSLKVNPGSAAVDTEVLGGNGTSATGSFTANLASITGWSGIHTFLLKFWTVGNGQPVVLKALSLESLASRGLPAQATGRWLPWEVGGELIWPDGSKVTYQDRFLSPSLLVRSCDVVPATADLELALVGATSAMTWQGSTDGETTPSVWTSTFTKLDFGTAGKPLVTGPGFGYAVATDLPTVHRASASDVSSVLSALQTGAQTTSSGGGTWGMSFPRISKPTTFHIAVALSPNANTASLRTQAAVAITGASPPISTTVVDMVQRFLSDVPHPKNLQLRSVPALGVTSTEISGTYDAAWAFLLQNTVAPGAVASDYRYPQMPTGKPSLWNDGAPPAKSMAAWDSVLALQAYSLSDPSFAWDCLEGLLSLVGADGVLKGEGLPTRVAQTLWVVYQRKADRQRLSQLYPALKRFLQWKQATPYWIFASPQWTGGSQRDMEFVVSNVFDQGYAMQIAHELGLAQDVLYWQQQQATEYEDIAQWFWDSAGNGPFQYYTAPSGPRSAGNLTWCLTGIALPGMPKVQADSLQQHLASTFAPAAPMGGLHYPKYPDISLIVYGLYERGHQTLARQVAECCVRDIVRAGEFAEDYTTLSVGAPEPQGVVPSCFGATMFIEFCLLLDGLRYSNGPLERVSL